MTIVNIDFDANVKRNRRSTGTIITITKSKIDYLQPSCRGIAKFGAKNRQNWSFFPSDSCLLFCMVRYKSLFLFQSLHNTMRKTMLTTLVLFLLSLFPDKAAGNKQYAFQQISTQNGLSSSVRCLVVSQEKGYVWIGARLGIGRFNGYELRKYLFRNNYYYMSCIH